MPKVRRKVKGEKQKKSEKYVDSDLTSKILSQAVQQAEELEEEYGTGPSPRRKQARAAPKITFKGRSDGDDGDDDDDQSDSEAQGASSGDLLDVLDIDPEEEEMFNKFRQNSKELSHSIDGKVVETRTEVETVLSGGEPGHGIDPQIVILLQKIGDILQKYRSGKLPKLLKRLSTYEKWEQCLEITKPDNWTASAMYALTKIFASNLSGPLAQRFYARILLPRVRDDIATYKRVNFHIMMALKKALFKTAAFFKGIILPLCESGDCSLREALILSSIVREHSVPVAHAGATITILANAPYTGAASIFLRTLLAKKYALAWSVIDACCDHFTRFESDDRDLPVLWHQCLLTFTQHYKQELTSDQKDRIRHLLHRHHHHQISPEVRRELDNSPCREVSSATSQA